MPWRIGEKLRAGLPIVIGGKPGSDFFRQTVRLFAEIVTAFETALGIAVDTLWDAKGDLAVGSGQDAAERLQVGADGSVLTADSAQALGIKWQAISFPTSTITLRKGTGADQGPRPRISLNEGTNIALTVADDAAQNEVDVSIALTGQVAIANGGTGQSTKQAAFDALSPLTTLGDLLTFESGHNVRKPIGTTGYVLTVIGDEGLGGASAAWQEAVQWVRKNGGTIGAQKFLNFIEGTGITLAVVNDSGNSEVEVGIGVSLVPIANGGTGQTTATAAFSALSPTTTKGDLIADNGTDPVRVGVGSDGQQLVADSAQAAGVKWADRIQFGYLASNQPLSADGFNDVTGITFPVLAGAAYAFEMFLLLDTDATTTGYSVGVNGPASPTSLFAVIEDRTAAADGTDDMSIFDTTTYDNGPNRTASASASPIIHVRVTGFLLNGANAGTFAARFRREAGVGTVTMQAGSWGWLRKVS